MKKDEFIEQQIDAYVEGTEEPQADLSAAKRALHGEMRRRRGRRRTFFAVLSACACVLLITVLTLSLLPAALDRGVGDTGIAGDANPPAAEPPTSEDPEQNTGTPGQNSVYSLAAAVQRPAGLNELSETYGARHEKLIRLGFLARADYTLYILDGEMVLLRADIVYTQNGARVAATVWADLTEGAKRAEELASFNGLEHQTKTYSYQTEFSDGEYLSRGNFAGTGGYFVEVQSSLYAAFSDLMAYLV